MVSREIPEAYLREVTIDYIHGSECRLGTVNILIVQVEYLLDDIAAVLRAEELFQHSFLVVMAIFLRLFGPLGVEVVKERLVGWVRVSVKVIECAQFLLDSTLGDVGGLSKLSGVLMAIFRTCNFVFYRD